jgi:phosphoribosylformylglycinamidine cyclo-ligase
MAVIVAEAEADPITGLLEGAGETVYRIGRIDVGPRGCTVGGSAGTWGSAEAWSADHRA